MKIYFARATQVNRPERQVHQRLIQLIQNYGSILNSTPKSSKGTDQQVHDQRIKQLEVADVLIAEATVPNLNLGYELCLAEQLDLPTVIVYNSSLVRPSVMISGSRKLTSVPYHNLERAKKIIKNFLNQFK